MATQWRQARDEPKVSGNTPLFRGHSFPPLFQRKNSVQSAARKIKQLLAASNHGQRVKRTRLIQGGRFVIAVDVEMVIPPDDPSEPCYESETVELLKEVASRAEKGDRSWLLERGRLYELVPVE